MSRARGAIVLALLVAAAWGVGRCVAGPARDPAIRPEPVAMAPDASAAAAAAPTDRARSYAGTRDAPREPASRPPDVAVADADAPEPALRVRVRDELGAPIAGAKVELASTHAMPLRAATSLEGIADLHDPLGAPIHLRVAAQGFATYELDLSEESSPPPIVDVVLFPGGVLEVLVVDEDHAAVGSHWLWAWRVPSEGAPPSRAQRGALTDARGVARLEGLLPGRWEIYSTDWRDKETPRRQVVDVVAGGTASATMRVRHLPPDVYASGTVRLPEDAVELDDGTIGGYHVEKSDLRGHDATIYHGGWFLVRGEPGAIVTLRIAGARAVSSWITVQIGQHGYRLDPRWTADADPR